MAVKKQLTGSLKGFEYNVFDSPGWQRDQVVQWHVRPAPENHEGILVLRGVAVEVASDFTLTYHITIWNVSTYTVSFEIFSIAEDIPASEGEPSATTLQQQADLAVNQYRLELAASWLPADQQAALAAYLVELEAATLPADQQAALAAYLNALANK